MENDFRLLGFLLGVSVYALTITMRRREILGVCFSITEIAKRHITLKELSRVEEVQGYKLIPMGFLSRKSFTVIHVLLHQLSTGPGPDDSKFYKCLRSASQAEIDEWFAEWKSFLRVEKEERDREGYLYLSRIEKKESPHGAFYFDGYSMKWYHQDKDGFLQWTE